MATGGWARSPVPLAARANCGKILSVSSNVINLNRFRKKKQREEKAKQAEINRVRHGRTQAEKDRERLERERAARLIDGKRLEDRHEEILAGETSTTKPSNDSDDSDKE